MTGAAIIELFGGIRAIVFAAVAFVLFVVAGVQSWRLDLRTDERDDLQKQVALWDAANASNLQAISDLKLANKAWSDLADQRKNEAAEAVKSVARERDALAAELERRRRERGQIYAQDPDAAAWGRTRVPARIRDQLRK